MLCGALVEISDEGRGHNPERLIVRLKDVGDTDVENCVGVAAPEDGARSSLYEESDEYDALGGVCEGINCGGGR